MYGRKTPARIFVSLVAMFALILSFSATSVAAAPSISRSKAVSIATKEVGKGKTKVKLYTKNGKQYYRVEIKKGKIEHELDIDASKGNVVKYDRDCPDPATKQKVVITTQQAREIAVEKAGGGKVTYIKLVRSKYQPVYKVKVLNGSTLFVCEINATDGSFTEYECTAQRNSANKIISAGQAKKIALKHSGGGKVVSCKLEKDDGRQVYDVEVLNKNYLYEMDIDAATGKVLHCDKELCDDHEDQSHPGNRHGHNGSHH